MTPSCVSSSRTGPCILFIAYSLAQGGRGQAMTGRAAILYTEMSGKEILQQWLDSHPEVVERHQKQLRKRGDRGRKEDRSETGQDRDEREVREPPPQTLQQTLYPSTTRDAKSAPLPPGVGLPLYLQPYSSVLTPSLLPAPSRTAYPHTLLPDDTSGWG